MASYTETLSKTPTKLYPRDATPTPASNAPFRFGFAATLLDDGYYAQEPLVVSKDPWWDEFAVDVAPGSPTYGQAIASNPKDETLTRAHRGWLGLPLGARERVFDDAAFDVSRSLFSAGHLDNSASLTGWKSSNVALSFDASQAMAGTGSLRVSNHQSFAALPYQASVRTPSVALRAGVDYTLVFSVKAAEVRNIAVGAGGSTQSFDIPAYWVRRVMTFTASTTGTSNISFNVGREDIPLWLDDVYLFEGNANIFTREFQNGLVVVNATSKSKTVDLGTPYLRIKGTQDPVNNGSTVTSVTIGPNDAAILVASPAVPRTVSVADVSVVEGGGSARFAVSLSGPSSVPVTVRYATANGSALAGSDYTAVSGSLSFAPGSTLQTVTVPVLDDLLHEPTESFSLVLSNAAGATLAKATATGTISDNDNASIACGEPAIAAGSQAGLFLWQDCATSQWHARVAAGGSASVMKYTGSVAASMPFATAAGVLVELPSDLVNVSDPSRMTYRLNVLGSGLDGMTFSAAATAHLCFSLDGPVGAKVFLGAEKVAMPASFDLTTLRSCN